MVTIMAFAKKSETNTATNNNVANFEKAAAFLNVSVKMADGSMKQLGGIPLRESVALHKALLGAGIEDLELVVDMHVVQEKTADDFAFATKSA